MFLLGYEVKGLNNLPETGPALIVYYHGAMPVDIYYFLSKVVFLKNRLVHTVADHFLFKVPGKLHNSYNNYKIKCCNLLL